jgi:glutathione S-transferase
MLIDKIQGRLETVNAHLAKQNFLMGDSFTAPDAYLYTVLNWAKYFNIGLDKWPAVKAFMDRVAARPSTQAAAKAEGLAA